MTPKDLEHWERIFKSGAKAVGRPWDRVFMAMARECAKIRNEENAKDAAGE